MSAQPCISMKLMLSDVEFGVLTEVGEENTLSPEEVLKTILEEYVELRPIIRISTSNSPCFGIGSSGDRNERGGAFKILTQ